MMVARKGVAMTEKEKVIDHNSRHSIGDICDYTLDGGRTWTRSILESKSFIWRDMASVRVVGYWEPLSLKSVAIVPKNWD